MNKFEQLYKELICESENTNSKNLYNEKRMELAQEYGIIYQNILKLIDKTKEIKKIETEDFGYPQEKVWLYDEMCEKLDDISNTFYEYSRFFDEINELEDEEDSNKENNAK